MLSSLTIKRKETVVGPGGVGHDSQSVPGEIFARAHFHLIGQRQTSPRAEGDVEIWLIGGSLAVDGKNSRMIHPY